MNTKLYEISLHVQVDKTLLVEAESEDEAIETAYKVCENTSIPVNPGDMPEVWVEDCMEIEDGLSTEQTLLEH